MQINTNFEFSDQDMIPNAHDAYAYRMESSEAEGQIAFCFPYDEISFPRVSNFSLREGYADGVEQRGYRKNRFGGDRGAEGILVYNQDYSRFVGCFGVNIILKMGQVAIDTEDAETFHRSKRQRSPKNPRFDLKIPESGSYLVLIFSETIEDTLPQTLTKFVIASQGEDTTNKCSVFEVVSEGHSYEIHCKDVYISWDVFPQYEF